LFLCALGFLLVDIIRGYRASEERDGGVDVGLGEDAEPSIDLELEWQA
jgi:hypothetical protein